MVNGISQIVIPARLYLEMIRTETLPYFRWEKGVLDQKGPQHNIKEGEKCKLWFPRNKHTQYLPASSPRLNHVGVLLAIPSPTSLKGPSGRRDTLGLGGLTGTGQLPGTTPQPTLGPSEFHVAQTYRISGNASKKKKKKSGQLA